MADIDATVGHITSAARDAVEALADQYAAELEAEKVRAAAALAALQAEYDAHMATHEPPKPTALLGTSLGKPLPVAVPEIPVLRIYYGGGAMQAGDRHDFTTHKAVQQAWDLGCRDYVVSVKNYDRDALNRWADTIPDDARIWLCYYHEHNGNIRDGSLLLAEYRAGSQAVGTFAHERGYDFGPIHNGANRQNGNSGPWGFWPSEWAKVEGAVDLYTYWGLDGYAQNAEDPATLYAPAKDYADSLGLPLLWGEIGTPKGAAQAAWVAKAREWMAANAAVACYWNSQVNASSPDYSLTADAARAWFGI
jgi:hypothetical protein